VLIDDVSQLYTYTHQTQLLVMVWPAHHPRTPDSSSVHRS